MLVTVGNRISDNIAIRALINYHVLLAKIYVGKVSRALLNSLFSNERNMSLDKCCTSFTRREHNLPSFS